MAQHVSWTDIESFYNVRKAVAAYPHLLHGQSTVTYRAKVKLHGTCAGVRIDPDGTVTAFSRSAIITPEADNAGFARWVAERQGIWARLAPTAGNESVIVFGEWCGPGVQKGVAINQVKDRVLAVFGARFISEASDRLDEPSNFFAEPGDLRALVGVPGSYIIPWFNNGEEFKVDWNETPEQLQPVIDVINAKVAEVEACDPWVEAQFGVKGVGEGLVFYPISQQHLGYKCFSDLCFKAKGEQHRVVAKTKPAQADPTVVAGLQAFAELVITPARLEQGCRVVNGGELAFEPKNIGAFLAWISKDVIKETQAEMEAARLEQKAAVAACSARARAWYLAEMKRL